MRAMTELCHKAAKQYANALVYHRLKRWAASEISKELDGLPMQQQLAQLEEQITIILVGGGFGSDPALKFKKTGVDCCDYCGAELKDKVKHATVHLKKLIKLVAEEGWQDEAPAPVITLTPPANIEQRSECKPSVPGDRGASAKGRCFSNNRESGG